MAENTKSQKHPDFVNSSPMSENSSDRGMIGLTLGLRTKFLDVSNISTSGSSPQSQNGARNAPAGKHVTKKRPSVLASKTGSNKNAKPKCGKRSQRMKLENKENNPEQLVHGSEELVKPFLTSSPTCSTISEGTASQIANVIRTGALDKVLFSSDLSSSCTLSSSFLSMARELGFEMSLLNLSTNKPPSLDRPQLTVLSPAEKLVAVVNKDELQNSENVFDSHSKTSSKTDDVERYRRMQCEKIIDDLQDKLLETQQQLAVAAAQGHKKEKRLKEMNQLLERVGESWQNLESTSKRLYVENEAHKLRAKKMAEESSLFEEKLSHLIGENSALQRRVDQAKESYHIELSECQGESIHLRKELIEERAKNREELANAQRDLATARQGLQESEKMRLENESELKRNLMDVQSELSLTNCKLKEAELQCQSLQRRVESLEKEESATRRRLEVADSVKDSMETELKKCGANCAIWEVEHQALLKKTETEMRAELEKQTQALKESYQLEYARVTADHKDREETILHKHGREVQSLRLEIARLTQSLNSATSESESLKTEVSKLRIGRSQILSRLQKHLQTQWSDALQLLYDTPQNQQILSKEDFGMFGSVSPPLIPETSSKLPLGDYDLDRLLAPSKEKEYDFETDQMNQLHAFHSKGSDRVQKPRRVSEEAIENWLDRSNARILSDRSNHVQKSNAEAFRTRRNVSEQNRDGGDSIAGDTMNSQRNDCVQGTPPALERLIFQPRRDWSDSSSPERGTDSNNLESLGSLVPERDSPSSNSTTPSPLQHYIHLLLKQPPRQQVNEVETINLSDSQTSDKSGNPSPRKTGGKFDKSPPPWK